MNVPEGTIHPVGSSIIVFCTVELGPSILESELSLVIVDAWLSRDGTPLTLLTDPTVTDTAFTYTTQFNSFGRSDSGNYTCNATVRPKSQISYLKGNGTHASKVTTISTGYIIM